MITLKTKILTMAFLTVPFFQAMAQDENTDELLNRVSVDMVFVEGGTFTMGATDGWGYEDEKPIHEVTLSPFYISRYEVTQQLWFAVMGENPSTVLCDSMPVNNISWNDCQTFIARLNESTGKSYRLPTEAEWEFAARGANYGNNKSLGSGYQFAGGYSYIDDLDEYVWYQDNAEESIHKIGTKKPNELGLYDMSGNVCEYVNDFFSLTSYTEASQENPTGVTDGEFRVFRGGSYIRPAWQVRLANRYGINPSERCEECGLRLAMGEYAEDAVWYLVADNNQKYPMSKVGMLVAADEEKTFSILDLNGTILAEDVLEAKFVLGNDIYVANIEKVTYNEGNNILKSIIGNQLTLIGARGVVELYTINGVKVKTVKAQPQETVIDVSGMDTGIYIVRCGKTSFKFNKN